jgi:uridine monophosphate synthetase
LYAAGCIKFGQFTLKSGAQSPIYVDLRALVAFPSALRCVALGLAHLLNNLAFDHIAAIPYAALPIGTATSMLMDRSLVYPRREAKSYGTKAQVEGVFSEGDKVALLDDLATTGESKFEAIEKLQAVGLDVQDIVVVIDREQGARETLERAGYRFHALLTIPQLLNALEQQGYVTPEKRREVDEYLSSQRKA